ncbi:MAG: SGNH/GDSL hydrolase family protein [Dehalococcoidia bacterium]
MDAKTKKRIIIGAVVAVIAVILFIPILGVYVAVVSRAIDIPGLSGALRTTGDPLTAEEVARAQAVEDKIERQVEEHSAFFLELTDEELTDLARGKIDPTGQIGGVEIKTSEEEIAFSAHLNGVVPVPCSGAISVMVEQGRVQLVLERVSIGLVAVPGGYQRDVEQIINQALDLNNLLLRSGATTVQQVRLEPGRTVIVGIKQGTDNVSESAKQLLQESSDTVLNRVAPEAPGADVVPPGSVAGKEGDELYLALGDSLAANVGVVNPQDGYVSRFHGFLERESGRSLGLRNIGISGESSVSIYQGQLDQALAEIRRRRDDGNPATKVSFVTLDLGANDLLGHLTSQDCLTAPAGRACQGRMEVGLDSFQINFADIVSTIIAELEPGTEFYIMTVYNPFDLGTGLSLETLSNDIVAKLNTVIRDTAGTHGVPVADVRPLMGSNAGIWTSILIGDIHPNATGYQVLAYSLTEVN